MCVRVYVRVGAYRCVWVWVGVCGRVRVSVRACVCARVWVCVWVWYCHITGPLLCFTLTRHGGSRWTRMDLDLAGPSWT